MIDHVPKLDIAVIGMSARMPGAPSLEAFWNLLLAGQEGLSHGDQPATEMRSSAANSFWVSSEGLLEDWDCFDADFFGISAHEAERMDPQHRLFLECAWEALEHAGYGGDGKRRNVGVFASSSISTYLLRYLRETDQKSSLQEIAWILGNDKDFIPTRVSYKLNLSGPSMCVQSACSSSLVAVHVACQSLLNSECEMALAGGVSVRSWETKGHLYTRAGIFSPDGRCRAFDEQAMGTVGGSGVGIVVLKCLDNALRDNDTIYAVIKGTSVNNDGNLKQGFAAPSVHGQSEAITMAHAVAEVSPDSISYVEAHGTGTALGDPVELAALTDAFGSAGGGAPYCGIGSVKTNIGHLDAAAGIAGLIKTVLMLVHRRIPPTINYHNPHPKIDFQNSPFYVVDRLTDWTSSRPKRRAGVSSFGMGGTNAHVILEESPPKASDISGSEWHVLPISARSPSALDLTCSRLADFLYQHPSVPLNNVAFTLQVGRRHFSCRRMVAARQIDEVLRELRHRSKCCWKSPEVPVTLRDLSERWMAGEEVDWHSLPRTIIPSRTPLPTYPFERRRYRFAVDEPANNTQPFDPTSIRKLDEWIYEPSWQRGLRLQRAGKQPPKASYLLILGQSQLGGSLARELRQTGHSVVIARTSEIYERLTPHLYAIRSAEREDYDRLFNELNKDSTTPSCIYCFLDPATEEMRDRPSSESELIPRMRSLASVSHAVQAYVKHGGGRCRLIVVGQGACNVTGREVINPALATTIGLCLVIPHEHPSVSCRYVDVEDLQPQPEVINGLAAEDLTDEGDAVVAYRGMYRWTQTVNRHSLSLGQQRIQPRTGGIYLITGGLGGIGFTLARYFAQTANVKLILVGRKPGTSQDLPHFRRGPRLQALREIVDSTTRPDLSQYVDLKAGLARVCIGYILKYLTESGIAIDDQSAYCIDALKERLRITSVFHTLFAHLLQSLVDGGVATVVANTIEFRITTVESQRRIAECESVVKQWPEQRRFLQLLKRCVQAYPAVLTGELGADQLFFPNGSLNLITEVYDEIFSVPHIQHVASLLIKFVERVASSTNKRPIRILEVGGGSGCLTWPLLAALSHNVDYTFTDANHAFVVHAQIKARALAVRGMSFRDLDISQDPAEQGFAADTFDVIVALDVVHATAAVEESISNLKRMLAPGGFLCLMEGVQTHPWITMTWGLMKSWWGFVDRHLRSASPLLSAAAWEQLIKRQHFESSDVYLGPSGARELYDYVLIVAQKSGSDTEFVEEAQKQIATLEGLGADVMYLAADVAKANDVANLVSKARDRFGRIDGVIHAAGEAGERLLVSNCFSNTNNVFASRVYGTLWLDRYMDIESLDFFMLCSSHLSFTGGWGQFDYVAACNFLDAYAQQQHALGRKNVVAVNWDRWRDVGQAKHYEMRYRQITGSDVPTKGITADDGVELVRRILASEMGPQVIVSSSEWKQVRQYSYAFLKHQYPAFNPTGSLEPEDKLGVRRPQLREPYASPETELQKRLCHLWERILGIDQVGIDDAFFELGGDSLLALQLVFRLKRDLDIDCSAADLLGASTVRGFEQLWTGRTNGLTGE